MAERIYHDDLLAFISDARLRVAGRWFDPSQVRSARVASQGRSVALMLLCIGSMAAAIFIYRWFASWFEPRQWSMLLPGVISAVPGIASVIAFFAWLKRPDDHLYLDVDGIEHLVLTHRDGLWLEGIARSVGQMKRNGPPLTVIADAPHVPHAPYAHAPQASTWSGAAAQAFGGPVGAGLIPSDTSRVTRTFTVIALVVVAAFVSVPFVPRTGVVALGLFLGLCGVHYTWLRAAWRSIPPAFRATSPGNFVDPEQLGPPFLVPVYNVYWLFTLHVGLAEIVAALAAAYGVEHHAKSRLAVAASACLGFLPLFPLGLVLMIFHMRSIDRSLRVLADHTTVGWPARTPEPPRRSYVRYAWPVAIGVVVLGWVGGPYGTSAYYRYRARSLMVRTVPYVPYVPSRR